MNEVVWSVKCQKWRQILMIFRFLSPGREENTFQNIGNQNFDLFFLIITQTDAFLVKKKHPFSRHKHGWLSKQHPVVSRLKMPSVVSEVCRRCAILTAGQKSPLCYFKAHFDKETFAN